jgi:hypothetical protein
MRTHHVFRQYGRDHSKKGTGADTKYLKTALFRKHLIYILLILCFYGSATAQFTLDNMNWQAKGPYGSIELDSTLIGLAKMQNVVRIPGTNHLLAGSGTAGLWKCTNYDNDPYTAPTWECLTNNYWVKNVSSIGISPQDANVIYISNTGDEDTGEKVRNNLLVSIDGGQTWMDRRVPNGTSLARVKKILVNPQDANQVYCITNDGKLYYSDQLGINWQLKNYSEIIGTVDDIVLHSNDVDLFVVSKETNNKYIKSLRNAWSANKSWQSIWSINNATSAKNAALATTKAPGGENFLYCTYRTNEALINPNAGNWRIVLISDVYVNNIVHDLNLSSGRGKFDPYKLVISTTNPEVILTGSLQGQHYIFQPNSGGIFGDGSWVNLSGIHWDLRGCSSFKDPNGKNIFYVANDGGIYFSEGNGTNFTDISYGLNSSEFWGKSGASFQDNHIMSGGLMHNTWATTYNWFDSEGKSIWKKGPDGSEYDFANISLSNTIVQRGYTVSKKSKNGLSFQPLQSGAAKFDRIEFYASNPMIWLAIDHGGGGNNLYKSRDEGGTWTFLSDVSSRTYDIRIAPSDTNYVYVITDEGRKVLLSKTGGNLPWDDITPPSAAPSGGKVDLDVWVDLKVDLYNPEKVWLARRKDLIESGNIYISDNAGGNWTDYSEGLIQPYPNHSGLSGQKVESIVPFFGGEPGAVFVGTSESVWYRDDTMTGWTQYTRKSTDISASNPGDLPVPTKVSDIDIQYSSGLLKIATYGRGVWETPLPYAPNPIARIATSKYSCSAGDYVQFYDHSIATGPVSYDWEFQGCQPSASNKRNPVVQALGGCTGKITATLTITDGKGLQSISSFDISVTGNSYKATVTNNNDDGPGSLRSILRTVCSGDTIWFDPTISTIILTDEIEIVKDVVIQGNGIDKLNIKGEQLSAKNRIFKVTGGAHVFINDMTLSDAQEYTSGGIIRVENGTLDIYRCRLTNGVSAWYGGAICAYSNANVIIRECLIKSSYSTYYNGGGLYVGGSCSMKIVNSTITQCAANSTINSTEDKGRGGAIYNSGGELVIVNSTITENSSRWDAGGVMHHKSTNGSCTVINSIIYNNHVNAIGGPEDFKTDEMVTIGINGSYSNVIGVVSGTSPGFDPSEIGDPSLQPFGYEQGIYTLADCSPAIGKGFKAIDLKIPYPELKALIPVVDQIGTVRIARNDAGASQRHSNGGPVVTNNSDDPASPQPGSLRDVIQQACDGDIIRFDAGVTNITLTEEIVIAEDIVIKGNGIQQTSIKGEQGTSMNRIFKVAGGAQVVISDMTLSDAEEWSSGGIIRVENGTLDISRCWLINGISEWHGGAICAYSDADVTIRDCLFNSNQSTNYYGGALYVSNTSSATVVNCTMTLNSAESGGAIYNKEGKLILVNTTISENTGNWIGGIRHWQETTGSCEIINSIIYNNHRNRISGGADDVYSNTSVTIDLGGSFSNIVGPGSTGFDAVEIGDPGLAPFDSVLGIYPLGRCSPAYDKGFSKKEMETVNPELSTFILQFDQIGTERINKLDAGAVEWSENPQNDWVVTKLSDHGTNPEVGSLRHAVMNACDGDRIVFNIPGVGPHTIVLVNTSLEFTKNLTIEGHGYQQIVLDVGSSAPILLNQPHVKVVLHNMVITSGSNSASGGAIRILQGELELNKCVIKDSQTSSWNGGAIYNGGKLTLRDCLLQNNIANKAGGALRNDGEALVERCTFIGNKQYSTSLVEGGAVDNNGDLLVVNSTFFGNGSDRTTNGGAILNVGHCVLINNTFSGNMVGNGGSGAAIFSDGSGTYMMNNIIAGNKILETGGAISNDLGNGFYGKYHSWGQNIIGTTGVGLINIGGSQDCIGQDPQLEAALTQPDLSAGEFTPYLKVAMNIDNTPSNPNIVNGGMGVVYDQINNEIISIPTSDQRNYQRENVNWIGAYQYSSIQGRQTGARVQKEDANPEEEEKQLLLYPNPSNGSLVYLHLGAPKEEQTNSSFKNVLIEIYDLTGVSHFIKEYSLEGEMVIALPKLSAGVYQVVVRKKNNSFQSIMLVVN